MIHRLREGGGRCVPRRLMLAAAVAALAVGPAGAEDAAVPQTDAAAVDAAVAEVMAAGTAVVEAAGTAAEAAGTPATEHSVRGPVTHLPMPRFVSLKVAEGNARRGPSLSHRIDWVFVRPDMPLEITGEYGHWRRVRDIDGAGGWVHYSLLSGVRTVIVTGPMADLLARPETSAAVVARAEAGVVARLGDCGPEWCRVSAGGQRGWVEKARLWGVGADEVRG